MTDMPKDCYFRDTACLFLEQDPLPGKTLRDASQSQKRQNPPGKKTTQATCSPLPGELGAESRRCTGDQSNGKGHQVLVAWLADAEPGLIFPARCGRGGARGCAGSTGSGGSAAGDGAFLPPPELFILGETEEYFVSLTKQHFTGA